MAPIAARQSSSAAQGSKHPAARSDPRDTPAMRQYRRFKQQHPGCILFFRMGDFYEMFDDDAVTVHKALGLTLTHRTEGIPMAGVPYHAVENYLRRLIEQGFRVAVCEQIQDPKEAKGVVDRAVSRVLTPGTLVDESLLDESASNLIASVFFTQGGDDSPALIAAAELSTGSFTLRESSAANLIDELARITPSELLFVETANGVPPPRIASIKQALGCALTARPAWTFRPADAHQIILEHFGVKTLAGFGMQDADLAVCPAGALIRYLQETQSPGAVGADSRLRHLQPPKRESASRFVTLDAATLRTLEIERTMRTGQIDGSVLSVLQHARSAMGKRLLRQWLCFPLRDRPAIETRQNIVAALLNDARLARDLWECISHVQDVARIASRTSMQRSTPRDLVALGRSIAQIAPMRELLEGVPSLVQHAARLQTVKERLSEFARTLRQRCVDAPPAHMREGGLFRDGVDAELDEARLLQRDAATWLAAYQKGLIEQTNINSLKVGYNKIFGYYIEITHANTTRVPDSFSRKQTLKNAERYITPELKDFEDKVTTAEARAIEREKHLFEKLCREAASLTSDVLQYAETVAELDVLLSFAHVAAKFNYCRPILVDEPLLQIQSGRHPVLDRSLGDRFVPNDCALGSIEPDGSAQTADVATDAANSFATAAHGARLALITGPNMAGKSTYIRQVALIVLLAHTGCFVPAERAIVGMTDRIFTRIGASDELHLGQSTFMVEMTETANILHHATEQSLVILDELGRGTSTLDGLSLAWAIAETLAERRCRTLFATHYHELTALAESRSSVRNLHVAVREWDDHIVFIYRILPGATDRSYGIHVAKIAGVPADTLRRAHELLKSMAVNTEHTSSSQTRASPGNLPPPASSSAQMNLFTEYLEHPALNRLRSVDVPSLSPLAAFDLLRDLCDEVRGDPS